jgi:hypothetical protein
MEFLISARYAKVTLSILVRFDFGYERIVAHTFKDVSIYYDGKQSTSLLFHLDSQRFLCMTYNRLPQ